MKGVAPKEIINKWDGLIHAKNGDLIDPADHHVVHVEESESWKIVFDEWLQFNDIKNSGNFKSSYQV